MAILGGDGSIILTTKIDESGLNDGLKNLRSGVLGFENAIKGLGIAGVTAFASVSAAAVKTYADFEQLSGGVQKIFNEIDYSRIEQDAKDAFKTMQMSANEYLQIMTTVGANFASTLGDAQGYEVAKKGMQAIADFATGTGQSLDILSQKYQMITKSASSYQSIADQFAGVLPATSAGFLEQAQAANLLSSSYKQLTEVPIDEYQTALTEMLAKGVESLGLTNNAAIEATETLSGSFNMLKSSWENLLVAFADPSQDITAVMDDLIESLEAVAKNLLPLVGQVFGSVFKAIPTPILVVATAIASIVAGIKAYNAAVAIKNVLDAIQEAGTWKVALAQIGLNTAMLASPITWLIAGITALVGVFAILWFKSEDFRKFWIDMWNSVTESVARAWESIKTAVTTGISNLTETIGNFLTPIVLKFEPVNQGIQEVFRKSFELVTTIWNGAVGVFSAIAQKIAVAFEPLTQQISGYFRVAFETVQSMWLTAENFFSGVASSIASFFTTMGDSIINIFDRIIEIVTEALQKISEFIGGVSSSIGNSFSGITSAINGSSKNAYAVSYSVPALAQGAVLPGGKPFLAMVNDQPAGQTNVETPLQTIVDAFNIAQKSGSGTPVILELNGRELGRAVVKEGNLENHRIGTRLVT